MTLISVTNKVADVVGLSQFASVIGNSDENALTMVEFARQAGDEISRRADWRKMIKTQTFSVTPEALATDFQRLVPGSVRTSSNVFMRPISNSGQWAIVQPAAVAAQPYFFLLGLNAEFAPSSAAVGAIIDYVSKNWILNDPAGEQSDWTADDDTTLFPEQLLTKGMIWRWKRQKGLPFEDNLAEFEADLLQQINADRGIS